MKRFWLLSLLMAGMLAMPLSSAFAKSSDADNSDDSSMEDVNSALGSMAAQLNNVQQKMKDDASLYGDVRARYVFIAQGSSNKGVTVADQSFARYRARLGAKVVHGDFDAKLRIATGAPLSPWSQNNTWDVGMIDPTIDIDTAQIDWTPEFANGMLSFTVGKMGNPLTKTAITWDPDIQPEGVFAQFKKSDFTLKATYFEFASMVASGNPKTGNIDLFMDNLQAEYSAKLDDASGVDVMVGYEYIPNVTLIWSNGLGVGAKKNNISDPGGVGRDFNNVEAMLSFKTKVGDVPFKIYAHATDNLNGKNLPDPTNPTGYNSTFTNQYSFLAGVDIGKSGEGTFGASIFYAQTDPNSQLGYLVDDDSNRTNSSYIAGTLATELEKHVTLKLSEWVMGNEYNITSLGLGSANQSPQIRSYLDCIVDL